MLQISLLAIGITAILAASISQSSDVLYDTSFKAYMDYQTITDQNSDQWDIQQKAHTDENGLRKVDDMYCVAVGSYYADECGVELLVQLDDGTEFKVIVSDLKQDAHTDKTNRFTPLEKDGKSVINEDNIPMINVIEFIVDTDILPESAINAGDVSELGFEGNIISIKEIIG